MSVLTILKWGHFCPGVTNKGFLRLYRQDCGVNKIFIDKILCFYYSKCFGSAVKPSNFVVIQFLRWRGFQIFHMFTLGQFLRLYQSSFMTKKHLSCILEPPSVSYCWPILSCSQYICLTCQNLEKKKKKTDFDAASSRDTEM